MNALVTIDRILLDTSLEPAPGTVITPANIFGTGHAEAILTAIEAEVRAEVFTLETEAGRERIKSVAYKIARSKTALDNIGKEFVSEFKKKSRAIDAERGTIWDRLEALQEEVRGPLTAWEDAEAARIDGHERALVSIIEATRFATPPTVAMIRAEITGVCDLGARDWQEFTERADAASAEALATLETMLATAEQAERDQAELAELRRMKAEREEQDRLAAIAKYNAERERVQADLQAKRDQTRAEQAEKDKIEAAARAVEQERERAARVKADEERAAAKLAANKKHRAKVHAEIAAALTAHLFHDTPDEEGEELVLTIIGHITAGRIPHVSIQY